MRESKLQRDCLRLAKGRGVLAVNIHGGGWTNKGFPDLLLFHDGRCVAVELKADSGYEVQPDQIVWRNRLTRQGICHRIVRSLDEFGELLREELGA